MKKMLMLLVIIAVAFTTVSCGAYPQKEDAFTAALDPMLKGDRLSLLSASSEEVSGGLTQVNIDENNWRNYFEVYIREDWFAFEKDNSELRINAYLQLKPEYAARLVNINENGTLKVVVAYDMRLERGKVNFEDLSYAPDDLFARLAENLHFEHDVEFNDAYLSNPCLLTRNTTGFSSVMSGQLLRSFSNIEIKAISGTLVFRNDMSVDC